MAGKDNTKKATEVPEEITEAIEEAATPTEVAEATEEASEYDFDQKKAASVLRKVLGNHGIDSYPTRIKAIALKSRYNDKERTEALYNAIMALEDK